jgi:hypothetical protein
MNDNADENKDVCHQRLVRKILRSWRVCKVCSQDPAQDILSWLSISCITFPPSQLSRVLRVISLDQMTSLLHLDEVDASEQVVLICQGRTKIQRPPECYSVTAMPELDSLERGIDTRVML